ncbi:hypothetical protein AMTRI_Chr02g257520 [Amborella trichopoda]
MLSFDPNRFWPKPTHVRLSSSNQPKPIFHRPCRTTRANSLSTGPVLYDFATGPGSINPSYTTDPSMSCLLRSLVNPNNNTDPSQSIGVRQPKR